MSDAFHEQDRERALAELRIRSLELRLALAHVDHIGLLLRDGLMQPWGARAALADLDGAAEGAADG
jgi:hypothetical protein